MIILNVILVLLSSTIVLYGQNLVSNPSFEQYTKCPEYYGDIQKCVGWNGAHLASSPDYFNRCYNPVAKHTELYLGVPTNSEGIRESKTGNAYAGLAIFFKHNYLSREYVQNKLLYKLVAGSTYKVSFYISLSDSSEFISNHISFAFTTLLSKKQKSQISLIDPMTSTLICPTRVTIDEPEKLNKKKWTKIEGEYLAQGGEEFLVIGSFFEDMTKKEFKKITKKPIQKFVSWRKPAAYYYLDDVCVMLLE